MSATELDVFDCPGCGGTGAVERYADRPDRCPMCLGRKRLAFEVRTEGATTTMREVRAPAGAGQTELELA